MNFNNFRQYIEYCRNPKLLDILLDSYNGSLTIDTFEDGSFKFNFDKYSKYIDFYLILQNQGAVDVTQFYLSSQFIGGGPKFTKPNLDDCLSLENVDLNFLISYYHQPFPTFAIEFPSEYAKILKIGDVFPIATIIHHHKNNYIIADTLLSDGLHYVESIRGENEILEDLIQLTAKKPLQGSIEYNQEDEKIREKLLRVSINYCILLTDFGFKSIGKDNQKHAERLRSLIQKDRKGQKQKLIQELDSIPEIFEFKQKIKLFKREDKSTDNIPTGKSLSPHWRRGHYKMQPHGPKNSLRKRIFIEPVLVKIEKFRGDLSNTEYECSSQ